MPIVSSDLHYPLSGGTSNTDPNASLGGVISTTDIVDNVSQNLFQNVTGAQSLAGFIDYRGIYVKNAHASLTLIGAKIWIQQQPTATGDATAIGLDPNGLNVTMETIANETTAPAGVSFSAPANFAAGLSLGDIPHGQFYGVWVRRTISASTAAYTDDTFQLEYQGDTAA